MIVLLENLKGMVSFYQAHPTRTLLEVDIRLIEKVIELIEQRKIP